MSRRITGPLTFVEFLFAVFLYGKIFVDPSISWLTVHMPLMVPVAINIVRWSFYKAFPMLNPRYIDQQTAEKIMSDLQSDYENGFEKSSDEDNDKSEY